MSGRSELRIQIRQCGTAVTGFDLEGRIAAGCSSSCLAMEVDRVFARQATNLLFNMRGVDLIDCAGIGKLIYCDLKSRKQGGSLRIVHLSRNLKRVVELFRLESVLEIFESECAAIASLNGGGGPVRRPAGGSGERPSTFYTGATVSGAV